MPDPLKDTLMSRWNGNPDVPHAMRLSDINLPNPKLDIEKALMRLSGTYPQAMEVRTIPADRFMKFLGAEAAIHPMFPKIIVHRTDLTQSRPHLEETLAHELSHVGSVTNQGGLIDRILATVVSKFKQPYNARDEELNAEASAKRYISRARGRWGDIPLKSK